ncbi:MAG: hypothetical protein J6B61_00950 [Romboutsia sp.]|nr:hypothetical protein [Romboutsia sp.]MBP3929481.1 hypothetical protein [Peptostreptococcaceae bacterium]
MEQICITSRDDSFLQVVSKSGSATFKFAADKLNYKKSRIDKLVKAGYLVENNDPTKGGKRGKQIVNRYSYSLGPKGVEYCQMKQYIQAHGGHNGHDHADLTCNFVYKLLNEDDIDIKNIKNEKELELIYSKEIAIAKRKRMKFSVCDLAVIDNNVAKIYEIETANYRKEHREKHRNFALKIANIDKKNYKIIK